MLHKHRFFTIRLNSETVSVVENAAALVVTKHTNNAMCRVQLMKYELKDESESGRGHF